MQESFNGYIEGWKITVASTFLEITDTHGCSITLHYAYQSYPYYSEGIVINARLGIFKTENYELQVKWQANGLCSLSIYDTYHGLNIATKVNIPPSVANALETLGIGLVPPHDPIIYSNNTSFNAHSDSGYTTSSESDTDATFSSDSDSDSE